LVSAHLIRFVAALMLGERLSDYADHVYRKDKSKDKGEIRGFFAALRMTTKNLARQKQRQGQRRCGWSGMCDPTHRKVRDEWGTRHPAPCTLHPAPCTRHPAPCTLHPAPCTLHSAPDKAKTTARATACGWSGMCDPTHRNVRDEWGTPKIGGWLKENRQRQMPSEGKNVLAGEYLE
jgi:hypothetical protein